MNYYNRKCEYSIVCYFEKGNSKCNLGVMAFYKI